MIRPFSRPSRDMMRLLPPIRGKVQKNVPLKSLTRFGVGGPAGILVEPADYDDLISFLKNKPPHLPVAILGAGSNLLVRDGGIPGIVLHVSEKAGNISVDGEHIICEAGAPDAAIAAEAGKAGLSGMEFLAGIPGNIGGALRMNAGCHGTDISHILVEAEVYDPRGHRHLLTPEEIRFGYRQSLLPDGSVFSRAVLKGAPAKKETITARMKELASARRARQPAEKKTAGSVFRNPPGLKAWKLIDAAGGRGLMHGKAKVSTKHANFIINTGGARARDIEALAEDVQARVLRETGTRLEWEIRRLGVRPM